MYRRTPKQAIVIVNEGCQLGPDDGSTVADDFGFPNSLRCALLQDLIAAAVRVDGVSIFLMPLLPLFGLPGRAHIPAGVEVVMPRQDLTEAIIVPWTIEHLDGREFERLLFVNGASIGVSARLLGTGLGALAGAGVSIGSWKNVANYALGFSAEALASESPDRDQLLRMDLPSAETATIARRQQLKVRTLEPRPTLAAFSTVEELSAYATDRADTGPLLSAWLNIEAGASNSGGAEPTATVHPEP